MDERCQREIRELHRFFEAWFTGQLPNGDSEFSRLDEALAEGFQIITPDGRRVDKPELLQQVRSAHGAHSDDAFDIEIRNIDVRHVLSPLCLLTYEEWQQHSQGAPTGRLSSVIFRDVEDAPNGVKWLHVHEVGLDASD
ncbi:MAG: DUF4440 domain-containing protein [Candidatus Bipolaricaulia bacterium]